VESYTEDKIKVAISIELQGFPHEDSALIITMDRNTGRAHFSFQGPQQREIKTGLRWRLIRSEAEGKCEREVPKF